MRRCALGAEVMGSKQIVKVLWGANGDCQCLMHLSLDLIYAVQILYTRYYCIL